MAGAADAILDAAERVFGKRGYHAASVREIAAQAGVSKAAVFHHFPTKAALYRAVLERACEELATVLEGEEVQDPVQAIARYQQAEMALMQRRAAIARLVLRAMADGDEEAGSTIVAEVFGRFFARMRALAERAQQERRLAAWVAPELVALVPAMVNSFFFLSYPALSRVDEKAFPPEAIEERAARMCALILEGWKEGR